jgi:tetratricopeptide (TPR) repeat protein
MLLPLIPPVIGISVFEDGEFVHDRYLYLPVSAFAILLAAGFWGVGKGTFGRRVSIGLAAVVVALLGLATHAQISQWKDNLTLFTRAVQIAPHSVIGRNNLAAEWFRRGNAEEAIRNYQQSLAVNPNAWKTNFVLGLSYFSMGQYQKAEEYLGRSKQINPSEANQYYFLGRSQLTENKLREAEATLRQGLKLSPQGANFHLVLGLVLEREGNVPGAITEYQSELAAHPEQEEARVRLRSLRVTPASGAAP